MATVVKSFLSRGKYRRVLLVTCVVTMFFGCGREPTFEGVSTSIGSVESVVTGVSSGTVAAEKSVELAFGAVGRVQALNVRVGDEVTQGTILAELENVDLKQSFRTAERELERRKNLREGKVISQSEYESVQTQFELARAALEKTFIRAPFTGIVTEVNLEVGQLSQITAVIPKPLLRLVDTAPRYIKVEVDEADMARIHPGLGAQVKIIALRREPFSATVRKIIPFVSSIREQDRTAQVELSLQSEGLLLPAGASADVEIVAERRENVLRAPTRAVLGRGNQRYVYSVQNGRLVKLPVTVGIFNFSFTEIQSGLSEGAVVVLPNDEYEFVEGMKAAVRHE